MPLRPKLLLASALAAAMAAPGCAGSTVRQSAPARAVRTSAPPTSRSAATSSSAAATRPARRFAVAVHTRTLVDTSRPTPSTSAGAGSRTRTLPTTIWYPARGADSGRDLVDAPPASDAGPFPLVVWGHGFNLAGRHYQSFLHSWASAGYVIAAPNFPSSTSDRGVPGAGPASSADERSEPGDLSFVATSVMGLGADPSGPLAGIVDSQHLIAAGHSQGAADALATAFAACCRDRRVTAAVIVAGIDLPQLFGNYEFADTHTPVLIEQGDRDRYLDLGGAQQLYARMSSPKFLLVLRGADHNTSKGDANREPTRLLATAVIDFCDRYTKGTASDVQLQRDVAGVGFAELTAG